MFRTIFFFILLSAIFVCGFVFPGQQNYILISVANKTIETNITTFLLLIWVILILFLSLEYIIKKIWNASATTSNWFSSRKVKRARRFTNEGIIKLLEGDWKTAEKRLTRWINHHDMPLLGYLMASEAAQGMGDKEKQAHYLTLASQQEDSFLTVELTKARQYIRENEFGRALDVLLTVQSKHPNNTIMLNLLKRCYLHLRQWESLLELLPRLHKAGHISENELNLLSQRAQAELLIDISINKGSEGLISHWNSLPRKTKSNEELIEGYIKALIHQRADTEAYNVIKERLKKNPTPEMYALLTELNLEDKLPAVQLLQGTLRKEENNPEAHSALAKFCIQDQNWIDAQAHLEKALSIRSDVADYADLAVVLEKQNFNKAAAEVSRKALSLVDYS